MKRTFRDHVTAVRWPVMLSITFITVSTVIALCSSAFIKPLEGGPHGSAGDPWRDGSIRGLESLARQIGRTWDSRHYVGIAHAGYNAQEPSRAYYAFFPLFPAEIWVVDTVLPVGTEASGVMTGWVNFVLFATILFLFLRRYLVAKRLSLEDSRPALLIALLMPFSVFFLMPYTEALFATLLLGSLYLLFYQRDSRWVWLLPALGFLLATTRNLGIALVPTVLAYAGIVVWNDRGQWTARLRRHRRLLLVAITTAMGCAAGLLAFLYYGWGQTGNFWISRDVQALWDRGSTWAIWQPLVDNARMLLDSSLRRQVCQENLGCVYGLIYTGGAVIFFMGSLVAIARSKLARSAEDLTLLAFSMLVFLLPLTSGTTTSLNRYLIITPLFLVMIPVLAARSRWQAPLIAILALVQGAMIVLYAGHYWIG